MLQVILRLLEVLDQYLELNHDLKFIIPVITTLMYLEWELKRYRIFFLFKINLKYRKPDYENDKLKNRVIVRITKNLTNSTFFFSSNFVKF